MYVYEVPTMYRKSCFEKRQQALAHQNLYIMHDMSKGKHNKWQNK